MTPPAATTAPPPPRRPVVRARTRRPPIPVQRQRRLDDWPRTTRVLPWMLAAFMVLIWEVPINSITPTVSVPFDLHFDRVVLPVIVLVWVLSLAVGGYGAPRLRFTGIHAALLGFLTLAVLSVVLHSSYLTTTLEYPEAVKKLTIIGSYTLLFLMISSCVRRTEVRAFMIFTLALAVICAIGMLYEYRVRVNLFYDWSDKLLPGIFHVDQFDPSSVDEQGRLQTRGPAQLGLEAAAMLAMALPIALVGIMHEQERRARLLYGLAGVIVMAAAISTYRKTAFTAPITIALTLAVFRRRELLRLAPLGLAGIIAVHALSPGAIGSIVTQLRGDRLSTASTVSDRTADYDAIRPDVWSHLLLGRGFGSYEQIRYRILDSELLHRLVEMGVLGLISYIAMPIAVVVVMRSLINARDPAWSPLALAAAASAVGFLTLSALFDVMSFPHTPYIFMTIAGFAAVLRKPPEEQFP